MNKNLVIIILSVIVIAETGYLTSRYFSRPSLPALRNVSRQEGTPANQAGPNAKGGRQQMITKGADLNTSPIKPFAYQIAPGDLADASKKALTGFTIESKKNMDGSTLVTMTPKNSEDQHQEYTVKPGYLLYFIEQTSADDNNDTDTDFNYRDDYGIITNANGIVQ